MQRFYGLLRQNGDVFLAVALAGCLVQVDWFFGVVSLHVGLALLASGFRLVAHSWSDWVDRIRSAPVIYYNVRLTNVILILGLALLHRDGLSPVEPALKGLFVAFAIVLATDRYRWNVLVAGATAGALIALAAAAYQVGIDEAYRAGGATNPIRFGMIALLFSGICATDLLGTRRPGWMLAIIACGLVAGLAAAGLSGSRGAFLAVPLGLAILAPAIWRRSRLALGVVALCMMVVVGALALYGGGSLVERIELAIHTVVSAATGGDAVAEQSISDRTALAGLAIDLFRTSPLIGVGEAGWNTAVAALAAPDNPSSLGSAYNQAHNQFLDDLAKGGLLKFAVSVILIGLPIVIFARNRPFGTNEPSRYALAGLVVSSLFAVFCLTESLLILSLPSVVHAGLIYFLLRGIETSAPAHTDINSLRESARPAQDRPIPTG